MWPIILVYLFQTKTMEIIKNPCLTIGTKIRALVLNVPVTFVPGGIGPLQLGMWMQAGRPNNGAHSLELPKAKHSKEKHMDICQPTPDKTVWRREDGAGENWMYIYVCEVIFSER